VKPIWGRKKGRKNKIKPPKNLEQGTSSLQTRSQEKVKPVPPFFLQLPKVYTKKSERKRKIKESPSSSVPLPTETKVSKQTKKGKENMIDLEIEPKNIEK